VTWYDREAGIPRARNSAPPSERRGFALAAALLSLMLIAALVAGVFFAATEETRMGVASAERQRVLMAAESAIEKEVTSWIPAGPGPIAIGETRPSTIDELGVPVAVHLTRLDSALYLIVADAGPARVGSGIGRRIGAVIRVQNSPEGSISIDRISERWWSELF
jgi:hypothetical protein